MVIIVATYIRNVKTKSKLVYPKMHEWIMLVLLEIDRDNATYVR